MQNMHENFNDLLLNRRSIRKYKTDVKVTKEEIESIFNKALRAPSANNLQPWTFRVIHTEEAKKKYSYLFKNNRSQYETSSFMIILFADTLYARRAEAIFNQAVEAGTMSVEVRDRQLSNIQSSNPNALEMTKIAYLDLGMVAMNLMLVAREHGYDTCPIGGFDKLEAPKVFNLENHEAVMAISVGVKDDNGYVSQRLPFSVVGDIE